MFLVRIGVHEIPHLVENEVRTFVVAVWLSEVVGALNINRRRFVDLYLRCEYLTDSIVFILQPQSLWVIVQAGFVQLAAILLEPSVRPIGRPEIKGRTFEEIGYDCEVKQLWVLAADDREQKQDQHI